MVTKTGAQSISAEAVESLNALVDENLYNIVEEALMDTVTISLMKIGDIAKHAVAFLPEKLCETAIKEAEYICNLEAARVESGQTDWEQLLANDMKEKTPSPNPPSRGPVKSLSGNNLKDELCRKYLMPYQRTLENLMGIADAINGAEEMLGSLSASAMNISQRAGRAQDTFAPEVVIFCNCLMEHLIYYCLNTILEFSSRRNRTVVKMEDVLKAISTDAVTGPLFDRTELKAKLEKNIARRTLKKSPSASALAKSTGAADSTTNPTAVLDGSAPHVKPRSVDLDGDEELRKPKKKAVLTRDEPSPREIIERRERNKALGAVRITGEKSPAALLAEFLKTTSPEDFSKFSKTLSQQAASGGTNDGLSEDQREKKYQAALLKFMQGGPDGRAGSIFVDMRAKMSLADFLRNTSPDDFNRISKTLSSVSGSAGEKNVDDLLVDAKLSDRAAEKKFRQSLIAFLNAGPTMTAARKQSTAAGVLTEIEGNSSNILTVTKKDAESIIAMATVARTASPATFDALNRRLSVDNAQSLDDGDLDAIVNDAKLSDREAEKKFRASLIAFLNAGPTGSSRPLTEAERENIKTVNLVKTPLGPIPALAAFLKVIDANDLKVTIALLSQIKADDPKTDAKAMMQDLKLSSADIEIRFSEVVEAFQKSEKSGKNSLLTLRELLESTSPEDLNSVARDPSKSKADDLDEIEMILSDINLTERQSELKFRKALIEFLNAGPNVQAIAPTKAVQSNSDKLAAVLDESLPRVFKPKTKSKFQAREEAPVVLDKEAKEKRLRDRIEFKQFFESTQPGTSGGILNRKPYALRKSEPDLSSASSYNSEAPPLSKPKSALDMSPSVARKQMRSNPDQLTVPLNDSAELSSSAMLTVPSISKPRVTIVDPKADEDDEDDGYDERGRPIRKKPKEESLADFLRSSEPPTPAIQSEKLVIRTKPRSIRDRLLGPKSPTSKDEKPVTKSKLDDTTPASIVATKSPEQSTTISQITSRLKLEARSPVHKAAEAEEEDDTDDEEILLGKKPRKKQESFADFLKTNPDDLGIKIPAVNVVNSSVENNGLVMISSLATNPLATARQATLPRQAAIDDSLSPMNLGNARDASSAVNLFDDASNMSLSSSAADVSISGGTAAKGSPASVRKSYHAGGLMPIFDVSVDNQSTSTLHHVENAQPKTIRASPLVNEQKADSSSQISDDVVALRRENELLQEKCQSLEVMSLDLMAQVKRSQASQPISHQPAATTITKNVSVSTETEADQTAKLLEEATAQNTVLKRQIAILTKNLGEQKKIAVVLKQKLNTAAKEKDALSEKLERLSQRAINKIQELTAQKKLDGEEIENLKMQVQLLQEGKKMDSMMSMLVSGNGSSTNFKDELEEDEDLEHEESEIEDPELLQEIMSIMGGKKSRSGLDTAIESPGSKQRERIGSDELSDEDIVI